MSSGKSMNTHSTNVIHVIVHCQVVIRVVFGILLYYLRLCIFFVFVVFLHLTYTTENRATFSYRLVLTFNTDIYYFNNADISIVSTSNHRSTIFLPNWHSYKHTHHNNVVIPLLILVSSPLILIM